MLEELTWLSIHLFSHQSVHEGGIGEETIIILRVTQLSEQLQDFFLGDFITKIGKDVFELSEHHGSVSIFVVELAQIKVILVDSAAVRGILGSLDLLDDISKLGKLLALLIGLAEGDTHLLGGV